ncbi:MAG: hypothetical protein KKB21_00395 [Nanoarchaeota archaeon]|nr:hypothetical protein [Nanoarchaeota archaeon]MBU4086015.1 hypothetical protein [Nanoarchaeota archaeon]
MTEQESSKINKPKEPWWAIPVGLVLYISIFLGATFGISSCCSAISGYYQRKEKQEQAKRQEANNLTYNLTQIVAGEDNIISSSEARDFLKEIGYTWPINETDRLVFLPKGWKDAHSREVYCEIWLNYSQDSFGRTSGKCVYALTKQNLDSLTVECKKRAHQREP